MSSFAKQLKTPTEPGFLRRAEELRSELQGTPALVLAEHTGCAYRAGDGVFVFTFNDQPIQARYPEMRFCSAEGSELPEFQQLELLYYFTCADGTPLTGSFVSFADLPGGRTYDQAFQGYTGNELVRNFGENIEAFRSACQSANGQPAAFGDSAFTFQVLPKLILQIVYWLGDEDFPSACKVLFEAAAAHYFPIEGCAILGSGLTRKVIKHNPVK